MEGECKRRLEKIRILKLYDLCFLPDIIKIIKTRRMNFTEQIIC